MFLVSVSVINAIISTKINGVYITCYHETENIKTFKSLVSSENGRLNIVTLYKNCTKPSFTRPASILDMKISEKHKNHVDALAICKKNDWHPCVIFESDAVWEGSITKKIDNAKKDLQSEDWSLLLLGFNPIDYNAVKKQHKWESQKIKKNTIQLEGTAGGCHAYMAKNSSLMHTLLKYRGVTDIRGNTYGTPCIEFWSSPNLNVFLSLEAKVTQNNKNSDEGILWDYNKKNDEFIVESEPLTKKIIRFLENYFIFSDWRNFFCAVNCLLILTLIYILKFKVNFVNNINTKLLLKPIQKLW